MTRHFLIIPLLAVLALAGPSVTLKNTTYEGRPALLLTNDRLELTVTLEGSTLASLVLSDDNEKLNPLWNPARMARELGSATTRATVGGHFVCVDGFGQASTEERAAGMTQHGEAHLATFEVKPGELGNAGAVTLSAKLPIVQEFFTRTFRMVQNENVVYVESALENLMGFDRPVNWAEHATIGSPFVTSGITVVDVSGSRAHTRPWQPQPPRANQANLQPQSLRRLASDQDFIWPMAPGVDGKPVDLRMTPGDPHYTDHSAYLFDPAQKLAWVTAINLDKKLMLGYVFKREEYPWLQMWGSFPATGKMARGLEFSTQPYDVPRREVLSAIPLFGAPMVRWLPAKSRIESRFLVFYTRVPEGFKKVDVVRLENGQLVIEDRAAQKRITLAASLGL